MEDLPHSIPSHAVVVEESIEEENENEFDQQE